MEPGPLALESDALPTTLRYAARLQNNWSLLISFLCKDADMNF